MNRKMIASLMAISVLVSSSVYGATTPTQTIEITTHAEASGVVDTAQEVTKTLLTLDGAIEKGLANSILLQQVKNKADIAKLVASNSKDTQTKLNNAATELDAAGYAITDGRESIYDGANQIDSAYAKLDAGVAPSDIDVPLPTGGSIKIPKDSNIKAYLKAAFIQFGMSEAAAEAQAVQITPQVIAGARKKVDELADQLEVNKKRLEESTEKYLSSKSQYDATVQFAIANVANKLSTSTITSLKTSALGKLVVEMATTQDEVTSYSMNIYKNQVALLIENSYCEALKQQKLLKVKEKAMERGAVQYELAKAAYEVGAKSKDDMIIAKTYYDSTIMSRDLQYKDYNAAMIDLKKNMNIPLDQEIELAEIDASTDESYDLNQGIKSGLSVRLEIKMAEAQGKLYDCLMSAVTASDYSQTSTEHKEVELLQQQAKLAINSQKVEVESSIRNSYQTMVSLQNVAKKSEELVASANETVEIAKVKYEVGYGYDNALLAQLNLESMSGTVVEVLAAEENLINIEEKAIEAKNGYNLARLKYLNDIGILPYK